jgi:adenylate kinase family enzyme
MEELKNSIQSYQLRKLIEVQFVEYEQEREDSMCGRYEANFISCDNLSRSLSPEANVRKPLLRIYKDDTEETLSDRLEKLTVEIDKYIDFVEHRAQSPNFQEAIYYSLKKDDFVSHFSA